MRVEIDGEIYDTDNAKCRFYYDGTLDFMEDFLYATETLYETEDGKDSIYLPGPGCAGLWHGSGFLREDRDRTQNF